MRHVDRVTKLVAELNQALLDAAEAGKAIRITVGLQPNRAGPTNETAWYWVRVEE